MGGFFPYCIGDFSEIVVGCVLIVAEHFGAGVAHQFQFVLVCPLDPLHHGGEGMAAAVRVYFRRLTPSRSSTGFSIPQASNTP